MKQRITALLMVIILTFQCAPVSFANEAKPGADVTVRRSDTEITLSELKGAETVDSGALGYEADELVRVIVELSADSLLASGITAENLNLPQTGCIREELLTQQEAVLSEIRRLIGAHDLSPEFQYTVTFCGFSLDVPYGAIDEIKALESVAEVHLAARYYQPEANSSERENVENTLSSYEMIGADEAYAAGYDGSGVVIAVIDTGLDVDHPAFADDLDASRTGLTHQMVQSTLGCLNARKLNDTLTVDDVFYNEKVPFGFNYADGTMDITHDNDAAGDHGTHVAGIVAGNDNEESLVVGVAPNAQLVVMKVFGQTENLASEDVLVAAIEDAVLLGADVINLSLGVAAGFSQDDGSMAKAIQQAVDSGVVVCAAAGNEMSSAYGNVYGKNLPLAENVDIGVISAPSSYAGVLSVASVDSAGTYVDEFSVRDAEGGEHLVTYSDSGMLYGLNSFSSLVNLSGHENGVLEFVCIPGMGTEADYAEVDAAGKIALVQRGEITFAEKCDNAFLAGAVGAIIYNNSSEELTMDLSGVSDDNTCPCVLISQDDGKYLTELAGPDGMGELKLDAESEKNGAGQPSDFSSWGVLADLTLKPDFAGVGGEVYSTIKDGTYGVQSGTSMATPQVTGAIAVLLQYLKEEYGMEGEVAAKLARTLLMNTAVPAKQADGLEYSPRKQGAGLINVGQALDADVYLTVNGNELPKAELGDDKTERGIYSFCVTLHNLSDEEYTYVSSASMLTECEEDGYMLQQSRRLAADVSVKPLYGGHRLLFDLNGSGGIDRDDADLLMDMIAARENLKLYDLNEDGITDQLDVKLLQSAANGKMVAASGLARTMVTVPAGGQVVLQVQITLSEEEKTALKDAFENGIYIEGYLTMEDVSGQKPTLSVPILAFFGDWAKAPLFEQTYLAQVEAQSWKDGMGGNSPIPFKILTGQESYLGMNPTAVDEEYIPERSNALNLTSGEGGVISDLYLDLLRNARSVCVEVLSPYGYSLYRSYQESVPKSCYSETYDMCVPVVWSQLAEDFTFDPCEYRLQNGNMLTLRITGEKDYSGVPAREIIELPLYIDGEEPSVVAAEIERGDLGSDPIQVELIVKDNFYVSGILVLAADGESIVEIYSIDQRKRGEEVTITLDVTEEVLQIGGEFVVAVADYAQNVALYDISVLLDGESSLLPDDTLLAFASEGVNQGWYMLDPTGVQDVSVGFWNYLGDVIAADLAGNTLFAVLDGAVDELYAIDAATFQPRYTFPLELETYVEQVVDVTYCHMDGCLYLLVDAGVNYEILQVDLHRETVETILCFNAKTMGCVETYSIACRPDGLMYLVMGRLQPETADVAAELYTLDIAAGGTIEQVCSLGLALEGSVVSADVDQDTGILYFTCGEEAWLYSWEEAGGVRTIQDLNGASCCALTLTGEPGAVFAPEDPVTEIGLSHEEEHLLIGRNLQIGVTECRPWYTEAEGYQFEFSSSNPAVAEVSQSGLVSAHSAGVAEISVAASRPGEETIIAVCLVVVEADSVFYGLEGDQWVNFHGNDRRTTPIRQSMITDASAAAYGIGAGPSGQDVIFVIDRGKKMWTEETVTYTLYTYDAVTLDLLESMPLSNLWANLGREIPLSGFHDMAYDPYWDMLIAVSGRMCYAIDPDEHVVHRVYGVEGCPEDRSLVGVAIDDGGIGWLLDSEGTLYQMDGYQSFEVLCHKASDLSVGSLGAGAASLSYDQLRGVLWVQWGRSLYSLDLHQNGMNMIHSGYLPVDISSLFLRRYN